METTTALEVFETGLTKSAIKSMAQNAIESIKETGNVLQVAEAISCMEAFIKEVKADESFKEYTREEISKYPKGYVSPSGAKLECAETGSKYCFDECNDREYPVLIAQLEELKLKIAEKEKYLKGIPMAGKEEKDFDPSTGEYFTWMVYPPFKTSISSYKVTLSK